LPGGQCIAGWIILITIFASAHGYSLSQGRFQYYWQLLQSVFKQ